MRRQTFAVSSVSVPLVIPQPAAKVIATTLQVVGCLFMRFLFLLRFALRLQFTRLFPLLSFASGLARLVHVVIQPLLACKGTVALPARKLDARFGNSFVICDDVIEQAAMVETFEPANIAVDDNRAGDHCLV